MSDSVLIGLWDDYDLILAFRKVWTLPSRTGTVIITLLAILVTFTANRSWKIWRFLLHGLLEAIGRRFPAQSQPVVRQQQAILRNSETTGEALLSTLDLVTKKQAPPRVRALAITMAVFMLLHWGVFLTLGILTTQVKLGDTVRSLATNDSGIWFPIPDMDPALSVRISAELNINKTVAAENYVRNCYTSVSTAISDCNLFAKQLFAHTTQLTPCPLRDTTLCIGPGSGALVVESSNISWSDLGINWLHSKDVYLRRRSTFTPTDASSFLYSRAASRIYADRLPPSYPSVEDPEQIQVFSFTVGETGLNESQTYRHNDIGGEYEVLTTWARNGSFVVEALQP
jgi:hypothetical protein